MTTGLIVTLTVILVVCILVLGFALGNLFQLLWGPSAQEEKTLKQLEDLRDRVREWLEGK